jgi:ribose transport system ATP-binding protein
VSSPPVQPKLAIRGASKRFGSTTALDDVSLEIERGTIHALVGGNGSGKSTLIKILAGVVSADAGEIEWTGRRFDLTSFTPHLASELGFRFVHQQSSVFPDLTVAENLALGHGFVKGRGGRIRWRAQTKRAAEVLERFEIDVNPQDSMASLGHASRTMVAIARALQGDEEATTSVLVLDEPTAALPAADANKLLEALRRHAVDGVSILLISHRLEEILSAADRVSALRDGRLIATRERADLTHDDLVKLIVGRSVDELQKAVQAKTATNGKTPGRDPIALEVSHLKGGAVQDATLTVHSGEVVGVAGLLGSGRSTLLRLLFGAAPVRSGTIRLCGSEVTFSSPRGAKAAGVAYVPENRGRDAAFLDLTVEENLSVAALETYWAHGHLHHRREHRDTRDLLSTYRVKCESPDAPLSSLSGGNQQKVILARWIRRQPKLLLLDEPTQGVDVAARAEIYALVRQAAELGTGVLVVSSDPDEIEVLCDRVLVMERGRISSDFATAGLEDVDIEQMIAESKV